MNQQQVTRGKPRPTDISKKNLIGQVSASPTIVVSSVAVSGGQITANAGRNLSTQFLATENGNVREMRRLAEYANLRDIEAGMNALLADSPYSGNRGFEIR